MNIQGLKNNVEHMKEIVRELYIFTNQLNDIIKLEEQSAISINSEEKRLLNEAISSLKIQLKILNNSIPNLIDNVKFYKKLTAETPIQQPVFTQNKLIQVSFSPEDRREKISLVISNNDKKDFLQNLSKSNLTINQLRKKFSIERPLATFGKPNSYAKFANIIFRETSNKLVAKGYFNSLNRDLRRMNSQFVVGTYVSMILLTSSIAFIVGILLVVLLLFFNISLVIPFLTPLPADTILLNRFFNVFWVAFACPLFTVAIMYLYPLSEGKSLGGRINQELPFVTIHMSAIASSGVEPTSIIKVILKSDEYKYSKIEFTKLMNLINFQGRDLVSALRLTARSSPSVKLKELFDGFATTITSGGDLKEFLSKHAEALLFDYKLDREKYTKTSETFMDIYISVVIAAPMIFLMLFVIMGSTGMLSSFLGLTTDVLNILLILGIVLINIIFLIFLKIKQPIM